MSKSVNDIVRSLLEVERAIREEVTAVQLGKKDSFDFTLARDTLSDVLLELSVLGSDDVFLGDARGVLLHAHDVLKQVLDKHDGGVSDANAIEKLRALDRAYRNFAEAWGLREKSCVMSVRVSRSITLALVANDVAHCIHNVADALASRGHVELVYSDDVYVQGVSSDAVEGVVSGERLPDTLLDYYAVVCREWSDAKKLYVFGKDNETIAPGFFPEDVERTACYVTPSGVVARLGNTPGHATHVEVVELKGSSAVVRVTYFDPDVRVRCVFAGALESEVDARCVDVPEDGKVVCEFEELDGIGSAPSQSTRALVAAMVVMPSSDYRVSGKLSEYTEYFSELDEKVPDFSRLFDEKYFDSLNEEQRVCAETAFVSTVASSFARKDYYW